MPGGCRRIAAPIAVHLDVSSQTAPFGIAIPVPLGDQNTDWVTLKWGIVDLGGTAGGGSLAWRLYPLERTGIGVPQAVTLVPNSGVGQIPLSGFVACGTGLYQWVEEWRQTDNYFLLIDIEGGSTPASSFIDFVIGGFDDE